MNVYKNKTMIFSIETSTSNLSLTLLSNNQVINKVSIKIRHELSEIIVPTIKKFMKLRLVQLFQKKVYLIVIMILFGAEIQF